MSDFTDRELSHAMFVAELAQRRKPGPHYFVQLLRELAQVVPLPFLATLMCDTEQGLMELMAFGRSVNKRGVETVPRLKRKMYPKVERLIDLLHFMIIRKNDASLTQIACWHQVPYKSFWSGCQRNIEYDLIQQLVLLEAYITALPKDNGIKNQPKHYRKIARFGEAASVKRKLEIQKAQCDSLRQCTISPTKTGTSLPEPCATASTERPVTGTGTESETAGPTRS